MGTELDDCKECCDADRTISRSERGQSAHRPRDEPIVHFGNIASSNQLQISASERSRIQKEHDVICFEMEAAGGDARALVRGRARHLRLTSLTIGRKPLLVEN